MSSKVAEVQILKWLFWGAIGVTILVTSTISYDPVNVSKLLLISGVSFALYFQIFTSGVTALLSHYRWVSIGIVLFLLTGLFTFINSDNPKSLAFYGTFGRNTGYLAYIALTGFFVGSLMLTARSSFKKIIWSLIIAGWINVIYCFLAAIGLDPIKWNNIYNRILGTFGNPNFIGAFLGIYFVTSLAFAFGKETSRNQKIALLSLLPLAFWEILKSNAIQGLALAIAGSGLIIFFLIRGYFGKLWAQFLYVVASIICGGFALAGALQMGPLAPYIYKTSVSLRGEYWAAGLNMGFHNLFTGVGWDGYGEWFRRERRPSALVLPGPETVTNAAHNVFIDIFAYGGLPLILTYLLLVSFSLIAAIKVIIRNPKYDPIFIALFAAWFCYNLQAFISINQIGLAVWGWMLSGSLIAYERMSRHSSISESTLETVQGSGKRNNKTRNIQSKQLGGYIAGVSGFAIGLLIALPPFINDAQWRSSLASKDANKVIASATKWPIDSYRLSNNAILLEQSKLTDQAYQLAKKGVEYNPNYFDAWKVLGAVSKSTPEEKAHSLEMMKKLDPLNKTLGK